jgi:hypothetical protein
VSKNILSRPPNVVPSFEPKYFASVLDLPQIVVPSKSIRVVPVPPASLRRNIVLATIVGQNPYYSKVSKRVKYFLAMATFAAPRGNASFKPPKKFANHKLIIGGGDLMLIKTAEFTLKKADLPTEAMTGWHTFEPNSC